MLMTIVGIVIFFVGIIISVAWHELGHFLAARRFGIKVPEFFVGFGPTVWSTRRGETEYGFKAVPLGGFVRMIGMLPPAPGQGTLGRSRRTGPFQGLVDDARAQSASEVAPEDADRQFWMRAPWKRIIVMLAGPVMNLILAIALFAVILMGIGTLSGANTTVSEVSRCVVPATAQTEQCPPGATPSPAAAAGFQTGDVIVGFQGRPYGPDDWSRLQEAIRTSSGTVSVLVDRGGQVLELRPTLITNQVRDLQDPERIVDAGFIGVSPVQFYEQQSAGVVVERMGEIISLTGQRIVEIPSRVPDLIGAAFLGQERDVDGPVGVVGASRLGGEILALDQPWRAEMSFFLSLLAGVNISLFLFNLLPIPPLDGGQIFPAIWEAIRRGVARLLGRPDPGPVDAAKLLPFALVVVLVFVAFSGVLLIADVVNPVRLPQ